MKVLLALLGLAMVVTGYLAWPGTEESVFVSPVSPVIGPVSPVQQERTTMIYLPVVQRGD